MRTAGWIRLTVFGLAACAQAANATTERLVEVDRLYQQGLHFSAARLAFAVQASSDISTSNAALAWISRSLVKAGLHQAATYFFIRTLQSGDRAAIRAVLDDTEVLVSRVGADILRPYLIRGTKYEDYDGRNRSAYLYVLGKQALLEGKEKDAVGYLDAVADTSPLYPYALALKGSAQAILGRGTEAIETFKVCRERAEQGPKFSSADERFMKQVRGEYMDLAARCRAGIARSLYQDSKFLEADREYDKIAKKSLVWPEILFEQAWAAFGKREYNRSLGKLVTYKSPALQFVFNSEVDVLTAQTYLMMCLYDDASKVIDQFNARYRKVADEVKRTAERNANDDRALFAFGKRVHSESLHTRNDLHRFANRFVRGPYFVSMIEAERSLVREAATIRTLSAQSGGYSGERAGGLPSFLEQVLAWRRSSIEQVGGLYVRNSLLDYHTILISDFEKMAFIRLDMLSRSKDRILGRETPGERIRGDVLPKRRDDQYFWDFNGEFWADELGDYVFALNSECSGGKDAI